MRPVHVETVDGRRIAGMHFPADGDHWTVVAGATGVQQRFYRHFAAHLQAEGRNALTFDYRGIGASSDRPVRRDPARMTDWGLDVAAAIRHAFAQGASRVDYVGHSVGGQLLGLAPNAGRVNDVLLVAAQSGHWRHWSGFGRVPIWLLWHAIIPGITPLLGAFPSRIVGMGETLPRNVALQWARWGRHREYMIDDEGHRLRPHFADVKGPIRAVWMENDRIAPQAAVEALLSFYAAPSTLERMAGDVGHFGFFRPGAVDWSEFLSAGPSEDEAEPVPASVAAT